MLHCLSCGFLQISFPRVEMVQHIANVEFMLSCSSGNSSTVRRLQAAGGRARLNMLQELCPLDLLPSFWSLLLMGNECKLQWLLLLKGYLESKLTYFGAPAAVCPNGPKQQVRTWAQMSYGFFNSKYLWVQMCTWASWSKGNLYPNLTMPVSGDLASKAKPSFGWEERLQLLTAAKHQLLFEAR